MKYSITYKNIRHGYARIDEEGILKITIPSYLKNNEKFKEKLISKGQQLLGKYKKKVHILTSDKDSVLLFGERVLLEDLYRQHNQKTEGKRRLNGDWENNFQISSKTCLPVGKVSQSPKNLPAGRQGLPVPNKSPHLLKEILEEYSLPILKTYAEKLGYKHRELTIRKTKSKRGSCTHDQNISLNLSLVHLPTKYIRYVIIHEVCHLKIKNHSKRFRALIESFCPEYKTIKKEMRKMILR